MSTPTEDMLREHFAARMRSLDIPEPEPGSPLARAVEGLPVESRGVDAVVDRPAGPAGHRPRRLLAAAAVVVVVAAVAGVVLTRGDGRSDVSTDPATVPAPTTAPPTTAPPASSTTTTPPPPAATSSVVLGADGVAGRWTGSAWQRFRHGDPPVGVGADFTIVRLDEPLRTAVGRAVESTCAGDNPESVDVGMSDGRLDDGIPHPVAVSGVADPRPRPVEVVDPNDPALQQAAVTLAAGLGVPGPSPTVTQAVRADLDGDGTAETVVAAEQAADHSGAAPAVAGDHAVVFVLRGEGSAAEPTVVASFVADPAVPTAFHRFVISALVDLDGDGRMEVAAYTDYPEGSDLVVHQMAPDGGWDEVLRGGCGV